MSNKTIKRRSLLKGAALSAGSLLGLSAGHQILANEPGGSKVKGRGKEEKVTLSAEIDMFRYHSLPETFSMVRESGYRFVELKGRHWLVKGAKFHLRELAGHLVTNPRWTTQLKKQLDDADLTPVSAFIVHDIASSDESIRLEAVERWRRSIDAASELGLKMISSELTGDRTLVKEGEAQFRKSMDVILPLIEKAGIHISMEPHTGDFFEAALPTIKLVRSYQSKYLGYLHATPHTFYLGDSMREVILEAGDLLTHVFLADTFRPERFMIRGKPVGPHFHSTPGIGEVDFKQTFDALNEIGYSGYVSIQLLSHFDRPAEAAVKTRTYLENLLGDRLIT